MKKTKKVTKATKFHDIFEDENAVSLLQDKGMHCLGCPLAQFETIEQGAKAHGIDTDDLIDELNRERSKHQGIDARKKKKSKK